jgi:hypothetical protein
MLFGILSWIAPVVSTFAIFLLDRFHTSAKTEVSFHVSFLRRQLTKDWCAVVDHGDDDWRGDLLDRLRHLRDCCSNGHGSFLGRCHDVSHQLRTIVPAVTLLDRSHDSIVNGCCRSLIYLREANEVSELPTEDELTQRSVASRCFLAGNLLRSCDC